MGGQFEIHVNGMVYVFDDDQMLEVMGALDQMAQSSHGE